MENSKSRSGRIMVRIGLTFALGASIAVAQSVSGPVASDGSLRENAIVANPQAAPGAVRSDLNSDRPRVPERIANYVLGPEDQIVIHAFQAEELSEKPIQIEGDGYINLPLVGRVKAGGLSVSELEADLSERLKVYVRDPQVSVFVADYRSQPVSVVGDVSTPGLVQLRGRKTLVEVIALAGGLKADAGNTVTITRQLSNGKLPLPSASDSPDGRFSIARVNLHDIMDGRDPMDNLVIEPNDVLMIPKARLLYVVGEVQKPGGYLLNERDSLTVLQAVALAGGLTHMASPKKARILHQDSSTLKHTEVATDVHKILDGQADDIVLHADDILFIPSNLPKSVGGKALETAMNMAGVAVWRF
jgi:polysaccharide export outer membrane protein